MKNRLKSILYITALITLLSGASLLIYRATFGRADRTVLHTQKFIAAAAQIRQGLDYRNIGCLNDSSKIEIRRDSVIFTYGKERIAYKTLYNQKDYRYFAIRPDGVVVTFTRWRLQDMEIMVLEQPEVRLILNPELACPELPKAQLHDIGGH